MPDDRCCLADAYPSNVPVKGAAEDPPAANLVREFSRLAAAQPDRPYLRCGGRTLTYGQGDTVFRDFANAMRARGWTGDTNRIAVSTDDPADLLVTIWACLYGGIGLVLCPRCEDGAPMRAALEAGGARFLLTDIGRLLGESWALPLRRELEAVAAASGAPGRREVQSDAVPPDAAFLFQTSGTEGAPKWVECRYWQCFESVECMWREGALRHACEQTVFLTPPLYHSYGLSSLLEYTRGGSAIVLPSGASPLGPVGELGDAELAHRVTAIEGVPHLYLQLSRLAGRLRLPALRHAGFGGGSVDVDAVRRLLAHYPDLTVSVRYGLTETPSVVTHKVFKAPYDGDWRSSGRVMPVYRLDIVDASGNALGPEQEGEIVVSGSCVARYTGVVGDPATRALNTGDVGYLTRDGELVVVGRRSAFLKYRGFRLSPEHIESVIRQFPGIDDCRVIVSDSRLLAEAVSSRGAIIRAGLLIHLAQNLPAYSIPEDVIQVGQIPRTPSGKIRRH